MNINETNELALLKRHAKSSSGGFNPAVCLQLSTHEFCPKWSATSGLQRLQSHPAKTIAAKR